MRSIRSIAVALLLGAGTVPANAATESGDFAVYGWGARDCTAIVTILDGEHGAQARGQLAEWISGYITGQNRNEDGVYDLTPVKTHYPLVGLARNICTKNADQLFESVVNAMVDSFSALRLSANSPTISVSQNGQSITISEATVLRVQQFLVSSGHLEDGSIDGKFGPKTSQALKKWQADAGLTPNGLPDMVTLFLMAQQMEQ